MMNFRKHATTRERNGFRYSRYASECTQFAVERSKYLGLAEEVPTIWRALKNTRGGWDIVSEHRTRRAAERALTTRTP